MVIKKENLKKYNVIILVLLIMLVLFSVLLFGFNLNLSKNVSWMDLNRSKNYLSPDITYGEMVSRSKEINGVVDDINNSSSLFSGFSWIKVYDNEDDSYIKRVHLNLKNTSLNFSVSGRLWKSNI